MSKRQPKTRAAKQAGGAAMGDTGGLGGLGALQLPTPIRMGASSQFNVEPAITAEPDIEIEIDGDDSMAPSIGADGSLTIENADGSLTIDFDPSIGNGKLSDKFNANLAMDGAIKLDGLAEDLITEIEADIASRSEWMQMREDGMRLLGLKIEEPRGDVGNSSAPLEGMSSIHAPALLKACLKFQATSRGELLPAAGPVKVLDDSTGTGIADAWANILEQDMNIYLTQRATEYYPDTDRMLFWSGFGGSGFKKVYHCPLRRRPVSESVDAADLIVNAGATDLDNARRITHRIPMRDSMVRRMQLAGVYRDVTLNQASYQPTSEEMTEGEVMGIVNQPQIPGDNDRTIYEVLCERDFGEHPDGMPLPYKVVIDKDSHEVLEIRRNWEEGDPMYMPVSMYVRYPYIEAFGIYGIGLLHLLGNTTKGLTAAIREMLDAGMFANFPGFLYTEGVSRQETNEFRIPPGGGQRIKTGGLPINQSVMPMPYKDVSAGLMQLVEKLLSMCDELAGSAELPTGEGVQDAPVGTVLAIIDQSTKMIDAVHKRMHTAQAREFQLLKQRFMEDPEAFWRHNPNGTTNWDKESFVQALSLVNLVPVADPNTPTNTHRLMKVMALIQLAQQMPSMFNLRNIIEQALRLIGFSNPEEFMADPNAQPMPNPEMIKAQAQLQKVQQQGKDAMARIAADHQKNKIELIKAQLQHKAQMSEVQARTTIDADRLQHDKRVDGADIIKDTTDSLGALGNIPPRATAGVGAGPSAIPGAGGQ